MERALLIAHMQKLKAGDRRAFRPVFDALRPRVLTFARRFLGDDALAEDAAQRALLKLFEQAHRYRDGEDPAAWALAVTAWECRTLAKARVRRREDALADEPESGTNPERRALARELEDAARAALGVLPDKDRATLARALEHDPLARPRDATFRKRKQRATERLRDAFRRLYG